ncbi:MAG: VOC family protein [Rhodococcus sp. (in: high G+C Gram-positive bacteria)]
MVSRVVHFDVPIDDPGRAGAFYRDVFDWNVEQWGPSAYWMMTTGQEGGPGAEGALAPRADNPEGVVVYISVEEIDVALDNIKKAGGTPVTAKVPIHNTGWSAHFRDSEGNLIGLFQADPTVQLPGDDSIS